MLFRSAFLIMIQLLPDWTIVIMWINFVVVLLALTRLVFMPTISLLEQREEKSDGLRQQAIMLANETQKKLSHYEGALAEARLKGATGREQIITQGREEERSLIDSARKETETNLKGLRDEIRKEKEKVLTTLKQESENLARLMVDKIMERKAA